MTACLLLLTTSAFAASTETVDSLNAFFAKVEVCKAQMNAKDIMDADCKKSLTKEAITENIKIIKEILAPANGEKGPLVDEVAKNIVPKFTANLDFLMSTLKSLSQ